MKRLIRKMLVAILIIVVTGCISSDVQSPTAVVRGLG
jgi:Flp pilus assembly protein TadD